MMIRTRFALLLLGLCGSVPLASAQESIGDLTKGVLAPAPVPAFIDSLYVNQWIALNANGGISGKLVGLDTSGTAAPRPAVEVVLVQNGNAVASTMTDSSGAFVLQGLVPGTFTFVAKSDFTFATFGLNVLPTASGSPSSLNVCASTIPYGQAFQIISESWVPGNNTVVSSTFERDPLGSNRGMVTTTKVNLQNGDLVGKVSRAGLPLNEQDLSGNVAHVLQGGRKVADAPVSRNGSYRIKNLPAGVYDLIIVGKNGTAAVGFEAVESKAVTSTTSLSQVRFVALQETVDSLNIELANPTDLPNIEEVAPQPIDEFVGPPMDMGAPMGGGFGGGGGGLGGGGAGGGGGLGGGIGGLLGIAGLAVGVAALSSDDDFDPGQATIIVP